MTSMETKEQVRVEEENGIRYFWIGNDLQSVIPANAFFGLNYWSHMIPWFKPRNVLILGYGAGTVASLIRKIWGKDVYIVGVDLLEYPQELPDCFIKGDMFEFINNSENKYDYIVIDTRTEGEMDERLFSEDTVRVLSRLCNVGMSINVDGRQVGKLKSFAGYFRLRVAQQSEGNVVALFDKV